MSATSSWSVRSRRNERRTLMAMCSGVKLKFEPMPSNSSPTLVAITHSSRCPASNSPNRSSLAP